MRHTSVVIAALLVAVIAGLGTAIAKGRRPKPEKHFASKDIRLHIPKPKDLTGWRQKKKFDPEKEESLVFHIMLKRPDSSDPFDVLIQAQGWDQPRMKLTMTGPDGDKIEVPMAEVGKIAEVKARHLEQRFREIKEKKKLRKTRISATIKKGYVFSITGLAGTPRQHRIYVFGVNAKTYIMDVIMTTTSLRDEKLVKTVDKMIGRMIAWKP